MDDTLKKAFLSLLDGMLDSLYNSSCNDWLLDDTPENRKLHDRTVAHAHGIGEAEARERFPPFFLGGKIVFDDYRIVELFAAKLREETKL